MWCRAARPISISLRSVLIPIHHIRLDTVSQHWINQSSTHANVESKKPRRLTEASLYFRHRLKTDTAPYVKIMAHWLKNVNTFYATFLILATRLRLMKAYCIGWYSIHTAASNISSTSRRQVISDGFFIRSPPLVDILRGFAVAK